MFKILFIWISRVYILTKFVVIVILYFSKWAKYFFFLFVRYTIYAFQNGGKSKFQFCILIYHSVTFSVLLCSSHWYLNFDMDNCSLTLWLFIFWVYWTKCPWENADPSQWTSVEKLKSGQIYISLFSVLFFLHSTQKKMMHFRPY